MYTIDKEKDTVKTGNFDNSTVGVDPGSPEFAAHIADRVRIATNRDSRLSPEEFAVKVKQRRMEKYGF
jgi:hypothetical protein